MPLAIVLSGANRPERKQVGDLLDGQGSETPALLDDQGQPRAPHRCLDRGDDSEACREGAAAHGSISPMPPKASAAPSVPPGDPARHLPRCWVVEVGHAWFTRFGRLLIRWEKKAATYLGVVPWAACLIV